MYQREEQVARQLNFFENPIPKGYETDMCVTKVTKDQLKEFQDEYCERCSFKDKQNLTIRVLEKIMQEIISQEEILFGKRDELKINPKDHNLTFFRISRTNPQKIDIKENKYQHNITQGPINSVSLPHCLKYIAGF